MVECKYTLEIPKDKVKDYLNSIIIGIYGLSIENIPEILGGTSKSGNESVVEKPNKFIYKFIQSTNISLYNVLPKVIITNLNTSYDNEEIITCIQKHITKCVHDYYFTENTPIFELNTTFQIGSTDLKNLIHQLTKEQTIKKFYPIRDDIYLICTRLPLLFEIGINENEELYIATPTLIVFDIEDGFFGNSSKYLKRLNREFYEWEDKKDITLKVLQDITI